MYNRYIPQPDGSFRRNRIQDRTQSPPPRTELPAAKQEQCQPPPETPQHSKSENHRINKTPPSRQEKSISGFLRQILPKDLDTGDLLIILLLLLIAGDCAEDQNTAMLTLAMYLFM